jgi:CheY-like chemotaxis protein
MMAHLLVVEDDLAIRDLVATFLRRSGHTVAVAVDGIQALTIVRVARPDLIVLDMGLPKLNGWQTAQRLRARQETASIPIVALTAYALEEDRKRAIDVGCDAFVAKPIDFNVLITTIDRLLARIGTSA